MSGKKALLSMTRGDDMKTINAYEKPHKWHNTHGLIRGYRWDDTLDRKLDHIMQPYKQWWMA